MDVLPYNLPRAAPLQVYGYVYSLQVKALTIGLGKASNVLYLCLCVYIYYKVETFVCKRAGSFQWYSAQICTSVFSFLYVYIVLCAAFHSLLYVPRF